MPLWPIGVLLAFSVLLGGGTHVGFFSDVIVQLIAAPVLIAALPFTLRPGPVDEGTRRAILLFGLAVVVLILIQLLPLPFGEWSATRLLSGISFDRDGVPNKVWAPVSVSPQATWASAVSLLVPAAMFLSVIQCNLRQRLVLTWVLLALGAGALLLAFLQMAGGQNSELRFYEVTNPTEAVGFFANRNHFAAQLYVTLILGGIWLVIATSHLPRTRSLQSPKALMLTAAAVFLVSIVAGLAMARSRAGLLLGMIALGGIFLLMRSHESRKKSSHPSKLHKGHIIVALGIFAVLFAAQFGFGGVLSRFSGDPLKDLRIPLTITTFELAFRSLPFGTGFGTFVPVYATGEKAWDLSDVYANRAHNDLAEFFLETGIPGAILLLAFLIWFGRQAYRLWFWPQAEKNNHELLLRRAATLIIALLLAHSLVDYPLRTTAHSAIFAFFCAICATKTRSQEDAVELTERVFVPSKSTFPKLPVEKWGSDMNWPKSWRR